MKDYLKYNKFLGSVHFSANDEVFYGKIEGITDLITFEGTSVKQLTKSFRNAVEDYIALCKEVGKEPHKSFKGSFNIRISEELHSNAFRQAILEDISLNQFVKEAIELKLMK